MVQLTPAEHIEQSYDLAMMALADYLTRERDAAATIDTLIRILDRDALREAITEVLVDARVHPRPKADVPVHTTPHRIGVLTQRAEKAPLTLRLQQTPG